MDNIIFFLIAEGCSLLFLYLGFLLWEKRKIEVIHGYRYRKVRQEDKKAYTGIMGKAMVVIGAGITVSAVLGVAALSFAGMVAGIASSSFAAGLCMMLFGQIKYNGGLF